jgi:tetratricopeptide (TPR) repeat protein
MSRRGLAYRWLKWRAIALLTLGRSAAAEDEFDEMVRRWPDDAYARSSRAHLRAQAGRRSQAIADMEQVSAQPDANAAHWFNLAYLLDEAERYAEAEPAFRRALELDPKLDRAWYGLGLVLIRLQRLDEAVAALERNTKLQPMSPYAWYQLARVQVDRAQPDEARKIIRHLKGFEPKVAAQLERETGLAP